MDREEINRKFGVTEEQLDARAAREGRTRSEELRLAVDDRLMKA